MVVLLCGLYRVSVSELRTRLEFDIDSNGEVSEDEAKVCSYLLTYLYWRPIDII